MPSNGSISPVKKGSVQITVCVPVYNVEAHLRECLDSIFSQDYDNFDVVMVDDGSTDGSGGICDEYTQCYPQRAFVVHKGNEGLLLARRDGFARVAGQYVMCVDSDDTLLPGALSTVASAVAVTGADVVRFGFTRDARDARPAAGDIFYELYPPEEKPMMLRKLCRTTSGSENPMWFKAVRRECVGTDVDFSEFRGLTFAEDFLQTFIMYDRAMSFCFLNAVLYYYRPGSGITQTYKPYFYRDVCQCLDVAEGYASRWERDYSCDGLMVGLVACRLNSTARYAEWLALQGDRAGLNALRGSEDFRRCAGTAGTGELLRVDRRVILGALQRGAYSIIMVVAWLRTVRAALLRR